MKDIIRIMRAADQAARWHKNQRRKGEAAEPYVNHILEVAALVAEASEGDDISIIAALMHDAVEDQDVTMEELSALYGPEVASIVAEVTDDKSLPKERRKELQVRNAPHKSRPACLIKLADKTSNIRSVIETPPNWPIERKQAYVKWAEEVVTALPHKPEGLMRQFSQTMASARSAFGMNDGD